MPEETYDAATIKGASDELERAKIHGPDSRTVDALEDAVKLAEAGERHKIMLQATQQAYVRDHEALSAASEKPATNQEFHQWLESYKPGAVFDHGDMAACWHAAQRSSAK